MSDHIAGSIKVGWTIRERDIGIDKIERELTKKELLAMYDRIEEAVTGALGGDYVDVYLDGKDMAPVRVHLDIYCPRCDYDYRGEYPWGTYERRWCDACLAADDEAMRIAEIDIEVAAINGTRGVC